MPMRHFSFLGNCIPTPYVAPLHALDSESSETIVETTPLIHSTSRHTDNGQPPRTNVYGACSTEEDEEIGSTPLATSSHPPLRLSSLEYPQFPQGQEDLAKSTYHGQRTGDDSLLQDCWNKTMDIVVACLVVLALTAASIFLPV